MEENKANEIGSSNKKGYYDLKGMSVKELWDCNLTVEQRIGLYKGNVIKYIMRAGRKDPTKIVEDLEKSLDYLAWWIAAEKEKMGE